jgi:hypothetical protein
VFVDALTRAPLKSNAESTLVSALTTSQLTKSTSSTPYAPRSATTKRRNGSNDSSEPETVDFSGSDAKHFKLYLFGVWYMIPTDRTREAPVASKWPSIKSPSSAYVATRS